MAIETAQYMTNWPVALAVQTRFITTGKCPVSECREQAWFSAGLGITELPHSITFGASSVHDKCVPTQSGREKSCLRDRTRLHRTEAIYSMAKVDTNSFTTGTRSLSNVDRNELHY